MNEKLKISGDIYTIYEALKLKSQQNENWEIISYLINDRVIPIQVDILFGTSHVKLFPKNVIKSLDYYLKKENKVNE